MQVSIGLTKFSICLIFDLFFSTNIYADEISKKIGEPDAGQIKEQDS